MELQNKFNEISEALVLSNTPDYLFRKIIKSEISQEISQTFTSQDIYSTLIKISESRIDTLEKLLEFYAYFGALYLTFDFDFRTINKNTFKKVYWVNEVLDCIEEEPVNTVIEEIDMKPTVKFEIDHEVVQFTS